MYGQDVLQLLKTWININKKLAALRNRRVFLLQCRQRNISPNHITNNMKCLYSLKSEQHPYLSEVNNILDRFKRSVLNIEIKITIWKLNSMEKKLTDIKNTAVGCLPNDVFTNFSNKCNISYNRVFNDIKQNNVKKINMLARTHGIYELKTHERFLYNYTGVELPVEVKKILCAGPKFSIPLLSSELPIPNLIKDLEYCIQSQTVNEEVKNEVRAGCINKLTNFITRAEHTSCNKNNIIVKDFIGTKVFLKSHPEIIVMRADKGNSTVVMLRDEYNVGMNVMLDDTVTYKLLNSDPTKKYQNQANDLVKSMLKHGFIEQSVAKNLMLHNSVSPKLYGLRKTHKANLSLRPVVSCIDSPSCKLATFVHQTLANVMTTFECNVKNSFEFVHFIKTVILPPHYVLVSLDVTSLFTNIPKDLVIGIIKNKWRFISAYTTMSRDFFCQVVEFLFNSSYFSFNGKIYQQLDGSAMGNPASPAFANLLMNELINTVLHSLSFDLSFIKLYVDDTLLACPVDKVTQLLDKFNRFHPKIKFTIEVESDGKIPFLDTLVIHNPDGSLSTNWYLKPTASGRVVNYLSSHALSQKIATIKNLYYRAYNLSSVEFHSDNEKIIKNILKQNNYPIALVNRVITQYKQKNCQVRPERTEQKYFRFPYIHGLSEGIQRHLLNINPQCKLAFYNVKTVNLVFTRLKDRTPLDLCSNLVYRIPCASCNKCYVGQTKQYIKSRMYQHQYDCRPINRNKNDKTALAQHHFYTGHHFDFSKVAVLDNESHFLKRNLSEMIYITLNQTVNNRTDTQGLNVQYCHLINMYKKIHHSNN